MQRAVVVAGDGVVARYPGVLCVARCPDPGPLRHLLELCADAAGADPGRALARRLAMWLAGPDAPADGLIFGTVAAAGEQLAVFLSGAVVVEVAGSGLALSGTDAASWTDRLLPLPESPVVLALDGVTPRPEVAIDVLDLRDGAVPGAGVVLLGDSSMSRDKVHPLADRAKPRQPEASRQPETPLPRISDPRPQAGSSRRRSEPPPLPPEPDVRPEEPPQASTGASADVRGIDDWFAPTASERARAEPAEVAPHEPVPAAAAWVEPATDDRPEPAVSAASAGGVSESGRHSVIVPSAERVNGAPLGTSDEETPPEWSPASPEPQPVPVPVGGPEHEEAAPPPAPPQAAAHPPRRAEAILGVAPAEDVRTPLEEGAPVGARLGGAQAPAESPNGTPREDQQARGHLCARGHLNDPRSHFCVLCGIRMNERTGVLVVGSRPPLGLLVFDDGATYTVDAEYLVGRMPEADNRVRSGGLRSIVVEDRSGAVSRVHAEIRINGWDVLLTDSGSRNGTFVAGPAEPGWTPLPPGRPQRMVPGTRVRMGGRTFVFESPSGVR